MLGGEVDGHVSQWRRSCTPQAINYRWLSFSLLCVYFIRHARLASIMMFAGTLQWNHPRSSSLSSELDFVKMPSLICDTASLSRVYEQLLHRGRGPQIPWSYYLCNQYELMLAFSFFSIENRACTNCFLPKNGCVRFMYFYWWIRMYCVPWTCLISVRFAVRPVGCHPSDPQVLTLLSLPPLRSFLCNVTPLYCHLPALGFTVIPLILQALVRVAIHLYK